MSIKERNMSPKTIPKIRRLRKGWRLSFIDSTSQVRTTTEIPTEEKGVEENSPLVDPPSHSPSETLFPFSFLSVMVLHHLPRLGEKSPNIIPSNEGVQTIVFGGWSRRIRPDMWIFHGNSHRQIVRLDDTYKKDTTNRQQSMLFVKKKKECWNFVPSFF